MAAYTGEGGKFPGFRWEVGGYRFAGSPAVDGGPNSVTGVVTDATTGHPLDGARISLAGRFTLSVRTRF